MPGNLPVIAPPLQTLGFLPVTFRLLPLLGCADCLSLPSDFFPEEQVVRMV